MKFVVYARYIEDQEKIANSRPSHRAYARSLVDAGKLLLAGPMTDGSGALFIYEGDTQDEVARHVAADPFAVGGAFASWEIHPWMLLGINHELMQEPQAI